MRYPVRTSNEHWLNKAMELYKSRVSITIVDDAGWGINDSKDIREILSAIALKPKGLLLFELLAFLALSILFAVLLIINVQNHNSIFIDILLLSLGLIICLIIPAYYLWKNKPAKIIANDRGIDIIF